MNMMKTLQDADLDERAQNVLHGVRDFGVDTLAPASTDRLRDLAERIRPDRYRKQVSELEGEFAKRVRRLERKLERKTKQLPIDTSLDRRRRRRVRRRGAAGTIAILGVGGAIAYAWWRSRKSSTRDDPDEWLEKTRDRGAADEDVSGAAASAKASAAEGETGS